MERQRGEVGGSVDDSLQRAQIERDLVDSDRARRVDWFAATYFAFVFIRTRLGR